MVLPSDPIKAFPFEISRRIFSYLDMSDLASCLKVSTGWNRLATMNFWPEIAKKKFKCEVPKFFNIKAILYEYDAQKLQSNDEIIEHIQSFVDKISLGQNARFRCVFGEKSRIKFHSRYQTISIEFKGSKDEITQLPNVIPECGNNLMSFDFKEDYFPVHHISDGSLTCPDTARYIPSSYALLESHEIERMFTYTVPADGPFQATLRFPILQTIKPTQQTEMELKIKNILLIKLNKLSNQYIQQKVRMYETAAGVILLAAYLLKNSIFSNRL